MFISSNLINPNLPLKNIFFSNKNKIAIPKLSCCLKNISAS